MPCAIKPILSCCGSPVKLTRPKAGAPGVRTFAYRKVRAFGWRSGLPLRSKRSIPTASAAEGPHPAARPVLQNDTGILQEPVPALASPDSHEYIDGMLRIPPSLAPVDHRTSSPRSRLEIRAPFLPGRRSRL